jgi:hypothetical protein
MAFDPPVPRERPQQHDAQTFMCTGREPSSVHAARTTGPDAGLDDRFHRLRLADVSED